MTSIEVLSTDHWHELRRQHVGSSEVSALFGLHPFGLTKWQLWHHKRGTLENDLDNTSVRQGQHFEPAIASYAQDKFGIRLRKVRRYLSSDDCKGLGASIDYEEFGGGALIPTELKWSVWGDGWEWTGDDLTAAPDAYVLQVQCQLACSTAPHGQLLAFTGGDLRRMIIPRSEKLIAAIHREVGDFWRSIEAGEEPPCDFGKDSSAVSELASRTVLREQELPADCEALFSIATGQAAVAKAAKEEADAAKAEILHRLMTLSPGALGNTGKARVTCGKYKMSIWTVDENPGKEITAADIGTVVGKRKGFLGSKISMEKETT